MRKNPRILSNRTALIVCMVGCVVGLGGVAHSTSAADAGDASRQAQRLLARADMNRGVCAVLGSADVALELATASEMLIHVRDPDARVVADVVRRAAEAGLGIQRLAAEVGAHVSLRAPEMTPAPTAAASMSGIWAVSTLKRLLNVGTRTDVMMLPCARPSR